MSRPDLRGSEAHLFSDEMKVYAFVMQYQAYMVRRQGSKSGDRWQFNVDNRQWSLDPALIAVDKENTMSRSTWLLYPGEPVDESELPFEFKIEIVRDPMGRGGFIVRFFCGKYEFYLSKPA